MTEELKGRSTVVTFEQIDAYRIRVTGSDYEALKPVRKTLEKYGAIPWGTQLLGGNGMENHVTVRFYTGEHDLPFLRSIYPIPPALAPCQRSSEDEED